MTTEPEPQPAIEQTPAADPNADPASTETPRSYAPLFMKGCGWFLLAILLGVGVLVAGKGDFSTVGSSLAGIVILLLVLSSSGLTGFWGNK
jgi:hypothetical protein